MDNIVGFLAVAVALVALIVETTRSRLTQQADTLLRFADRYTAAPMRGTRRAAAKKLLAAKTFNDELSDVLDFFTLLALFVERGAMDARLAYMTFDYWLLHYWQAAHEHIRSERQSDPKSWLRLDHLASRFQRMRRKEGLSAAIDGPSLRKFLVEESASSPALMQSVRVRAKTLPVGRR